jgi:hypothetical protein
MTSFEERSDLGVVSEYRGGTFRNFTRAGSGSESPSVDAATMRREFEKRLILLVEGSVTSRSRATQYFRIARRFLAAARRARRDVDMLRFEAHLREASQAHGQARRCLAFARLCERRVDCVSTIGGYPERGRN